MLETFVQPLLDWVTLYPNRAGFIVFMIAMIESLVIIGMLVPGAALLFGVGALIGLGTLDLWSTLAWAAAGAIVGDGISFWLGYHYREQLHHIWPFKNHPNLFIQGEKFFHKHGGKSIAFGRFVGPVRAIVPTIAGMMEMSPIRFTVINIISALAWAPVYILPGAAFGTSLELASNVLVRLISLLIIVSLIVWLLFWLGKKIFISIPPEKKSAVIIALSFPLILAITLLEIPKAPVTDRQSLSLATWQEDPPQTTPATNLQWAGSAAEFTKLLTAANWYIPQEMNMTNALLFVAPESHISRMPLLSFRAGDSLPLIYPDDAKKQRYVIQLWPTQTTIIMPSGKTEPLWVGNITSETLHPVWPVLNLPMTDTSPSQLPDQIYPEQIGFRTVRKETGEVILMWNQVQNLP